MLLACVTATVPCVHVLMVEVMQKVTALMVEVMQKVTVQTTDMASNPHTMLTSVEMPSMLVFVVSLAGMV